MIIVHVHVNVRPERIEDFKAATRINAAESVLEPGVIRFDVFQEENNPAHFILEEIYKTQEDVNSHKDTPHYKIWRNTVKNMMAEPRQSVRFQNISVSG